MNAVVTLLAGPMGSVLAIAGMMLATYCCRVGGVVLMSRVRITPRVERGLRALPGCIVMATILPIIIDGGIGAIAAAVTAILTMMATRSELAGLIAGLGAVSLLRAFIF